MAPKARLDDLVVQHGLAPDRPQAAALIMAGRVVVNEQRGDKPGSLVATSSRVRLKTSDKGVFVGRGGRKLAGALQQFKLEAAMDGAVVLDVGASTGGFTDCALRHGAQQVIAVDCGTNQLDWRLRSNTKVRSLEQTDFLSMDLSHIPAVDWVVADVSFTSLVRFAQPFSQLRCRTRTLSMLLLVKPQFELPANLIPHGGVVTDLDHIALATRTVRDSFVTCGFSVLGESPASVAGTRGNREVFLWLQRSPEVKP